MKNFSYLLLIGLFTYSMSFSKEGSKSSYYQELQTFKKNPAYEKIFDEDTSPLISVLQRDIQNFKKLSFWERTSLFFFFSGDVVVVTSNTMPRLYSYVESICNAKGMLVPTIFITREKSILNAFAGKLFTTAGGILLTQKIITDASESELEAVIAHELGHIKYNHTNKTLARSVPLYVAVFYALSQCRSSRLYSRITGLNYYELLVRHLIADLAASMIAQLTIGKKFEKEADEFACKDLGKAEGLIEFCKYLEQKEKDEDAAFDSTYELIEENKLAFSSDNDYQSLLMSYHLTRGLQRFIKWIYRNTPLGAHPSYEERIKAAEEYLVKN